jgi:hypothetical protein
MLFPNQRQTLKTVTRYVIKKDVPTNMSVLCHSDKHILPVNKEFKKIGHTKKGIPFALYICPLCGRKQGWIYDSNTGKPMLLWFRNQ